MSAANNSAALQPGAHLRLVSDRAAGNSASGIKLSGVSKTSRSRDGDVPSLRPLDFQINEGEFFVVVGPTMPDPALDVWFKRGFIRLLPLLNGGSWRTMEARTIHCH